MSQPAADAARYFLGIGGEQSGPLSESEVIQKIRNGEIPSDSLVWFEGLAEWQAIDTIPAFREAFNDSSRSLDGAVAATTSPTVAPVASGFKPLEMSEDTNANRKLTPSPAAINFVASNKQAKVTDASTFSTGETAPVFSRSQASFLSWGKNGPNN